MRNFLSIRLLLVVVLPTLFFSGVALASDRKGAMSPYFQVLGDPSLVDSVPLLQSHADINIAGTIADVVVRQTYKNAGEKPIDAIYVFPGSTRSAVYGMTLKVAGRTIIAEIQEKEQARKAYEEARDAGKTTSLLEQHRPNVFQMSIGNILPGEIVEVELKYTELLFPESGRYKFVYPAVVGPRYVDASGEGAEYAAMPYGASGKNPEYLFSIEAKINAPTQLSGISSDSHKINVSYQSENSAKISLEDSEVVGGNRDFILDYVMTESAISAGAISYEGDENFVLFMVQPPGKTVDADIPGREYIFVVDISGSMHGWPIAVSRDLMGGLVSRLRPTDLFNIVFFAGGSNVVFPASQPATPENLKKAYAALDNSSAGGGTELLQALIKAKELPASKGFSRSTVIVTDGYIGADGQLMDFISGNLDVSNYFAVGIGGSVNRNVIEGIARLAGESRSS